MICLTEFLLYMSLKCSAPRFQGSQQNFEHTSQIADEIIHLFQKYLMKVNRLLSC